MDESVVNYLQSVSIFGFDTSSLLMILFLTLAPMLPMLVYLTTKNLLLPSLMFTGELAASYAIGIIPLWVAVSVGFFPLTIITYKMIWQGYSGFFDKTNKTPNALAKLEEVKSLSLATLDSWLVITRESLSNKSQKYSKYINNLDDILNIKTVNCSIGQLELKNNILYINNRDFDWYITGKKGKYFKITGLNKAYGIDYGILTTFKLGTKRNKPYLEGGE